MTKTKLADLLSVHCKIGASTIQIQIRNVYNGAETVLCIPKQFEDYDIKVVQITKEEKVND